MLLLATAAVFGYLVGSIPTAWMVGRFVLGRNADVRRLGDGNVGATNIGRLAGPRWGTLVGAADILKGFALASSFDVIFFGSGPGELDGVLSSPTMVAGAACVTGHIWPVWLGFKGGRGAATSVGILGAVFTVPVLLLALPTALILLVTRNTSIAFPTIYYWSLVVAKLCFDAEWGPLLYCWVLALPVLLTDPRLKRMKRGFPRFKRHGREEFSRGNR